MDTCCHISFIAQSFLNRCLLSMLRFRTFASTLQPCSHLHSLHRRSPIYHRFSTVRDTIENSQNGQSLIFHSTTSDPFQNLAIEHYLLTTSGSASRVLFFYTNRPCVVIGRNQNPWVECDLKILQNGPNDTPIDLVRRRSGGGTVFHDGGNLNFSVIVPNDKSFTRKRHAEMVVRALKSADTLTKHRTWDDVWVNERHDITMVQDQNQYKVSGSAFKLTRGRALHHGTLLHTSPNLQSISRYLRSPGREYIQAKGVDSVRSPVSNLFHVNDIAQDEVRSLLTKAIIDEFKALYGLDSETSVSEGDCTENQKIGNGVQELMTDEWIFGQTPRFEYRSKVIEGKQITMSVNHGKIEDASFTRQPLPLIHEITNWTNVVEGLPTELVKHVGDIFPPIRKSRLESNTDIGGTILESDDRKTTRKLQGGIVETERHGQNVIESS